MLSQAAKKIADEAKKQGMWIYDPSYRRWYSPEDFSHIFAYADAKEDLLLRLEVKHPREGVEAGFKRLAELHAKLQAFVLRVTEYYK